MCRWSLVLCFAACGRVGFEPRSGGDDDDVIDFPGCEAGAVELCNGFDDDCDLAIDEDCPCIEQNVSGFASYAFGPAIAWSGTGYGLVWTDNNSNEARFVFVDASGTKRETGLPVAAMPATGGITWTGSRFVIGMLDVLDYGTIDPKVRLRALVVRSDGTVESDPVIVAPGYDPRLIALTSGPAIVYMKKADERVLATLGDGGAVVREVPLAATPGQWTPRVAAGVGELAILGQTMPLQDNVPLSVARFDLATGAVIGAPVTVAQATTSDQYAIAWIGGAYALLWIEGGSPPRLWFAQLANGVLGTPVQVPTSDGIGYPELAWSGADLVAAWEQYQPSTFRVHTIVARLSATGARLAQDRNIPAESIGTFPSVRLALSAGRTGVVWPNNYGDNLASAGFAQLCN